MTLDKLLCEAVMMKKWITGLLTLGTTSVLMACTTDYRICPGDIVVTDSYTTEGGVLKQGRLAFVLSVINDQEVIIKSRGYTEVAWPSSRLAQQKGCNTDKSLCMNDLVITDKEGRGQLGQVVGIMGNDVMIELASNSMPNPIFRRMIAYTRWPAQSLARVRLCSSDRFLCAGDRVKTNDGKTGVIEAVMPDRVHAMIRVEGYSGYAKWPTKRLGRMPKN